MEVKFLVAGSMFRSCYANDSLPFARNLLVCPSVAAAEKKGRSVALKDDPLSLMVSVTLCPAVHILGT